MKSVFHYKNGTPRQPSVCAHARGSITVDKGVFNNPEHSLEGLEHFSHVWIMFLFHKNNNVHTKAKVKPPRLNGKKVGVFSTRSPYRPNAIGLTLAAIESIQGATIYVKGIDILDGTPILDLKPYIPDYDDPGIPVQSVRSGEFGPPRSGPQRSESQSSELHSSGPHSSGPQSSGPHSSGPHSSGPHSSESHSSGPHSSEPHSSEPHSSGPHSSEPHSSGPHSSGPHSSGPHSSGPHSSGPHSSEEDSNETAVISGNPCLHSPKYAETFHQMAIVPDCEARGASESRKTSNIDSEPSTWEDLSISELGKRLPDSRVGDATLDDMDDSPHVEPLLSSSTYDNLDLEVSPTSGRSNNIQTAGWITHSTVQTLDVRFTPTALEQLQKFSASCSDSRYQLAMFRTASEVQSAIQEVLAEDPRSVYRRMKCRDSLYYFAIDTVHVTCWFDDTLAEVVRIQPTSLVPQCSRQN